MVPDYLQDLKPEKTKPGRYMLQNKYGFVPPEWRLRMYQNSLLPFAVSLWNSLEEDTRSMSNYEIFKETLIIIIIIYFLYSAYKKFSTHFTYLK